MSWLPRTPPVAAKATQPEQFTQPVIQDKIGIQLSQDISATQWYCPPAVGYAERNSASEVAIHKLQTPAVISPMFGNHEHTSIFAEPDVINIAHPIEHWNFHPRVN